MNSKDYEKVAAPFRKQINEKDLIIFDYQTRLGAAEQTVKEREDEIKRLKELCKKLLELSKMTEEDAKALIEAEKEKSQSARTISELLMFTQRIGMHF